MPERHPVMVTGGAGFIGSHLTDRLLDEGRHVVVVDDFSTGHLANLAEARQQHGDRLVVEEVDICSDTFASVVERHRPEVVVHLAAQMSVAISVEDPVADAITNVAGTVSVLEASRRHGVRKVVFASSGGAIYGEAAADEVPLPETYPGPGLSPYGAAKRCGEEYLASFANLYGLSWTAIAPANVYGPRQDPACEGGVVAIFAQRMLDDEPCVINGDGGHTRDYVYVADVVDALVRAMDKGAGERFNAGTGVSTSVLELFEALAKEIGYPHPAEHGPPRLGDVRHNAISPRKAGEQLGWAPRTGLEDGIRATVAWMRNVSAS